MTRVRRRSVVAWVAVLAVALCPLALPGRAAAVSSGVVISQLYGGGGNTGAPYLNDYVELFNRGAAPVSLTGWSIQYASATGTGNFGASSAQLTELSGSLAPGQYLLIQEAAGSGPSAALPSPDVVDATPISMSASAGKVALVNTTTSLGCNGGSTPCSATALAQIVDFVGYGGANFFEGAGAAPTISNTTAASRAGGGCTDTDDNAADFTAGAPAPRNTATAVHVCGGDAAPSITSRTPSGGATNVPVDANVTITFSEAVNVSGTWFAIGCGGSGAHTAAVSGGPVTFTLDPSADFASGESCTVTVLAAGVTDQDALDPPDQMAANVAWTFTTVAPSLRIHAIQGAAHTSPVAGQAVADVPGLVTAKRSNGFYLQDPSPDADDATSEGIFVFTSSAPTVSVGDSVFVNGTVSEFRPGGSASTNLTTTELVGPSVTVLSSGNPLPAPMVVGTGGRIPPSTVIEDDAVGSVETSGAFDPATDGIDFYESLEAMLVRLNDAVAVGPRNAFGEIPVLGDDGVNASVRTARGGIVVRSGDFNPERIFLDDGILGTPVVNVGDHFTTPVVGVLDYSFGNFKLNITAPLAVVAGGLLKESAVAAGLHQLAVATCNVENLDPTDPPAKFSTLAAIIANNLAAPDLVALEEIQDNDGAANTSVTAANVTLDMLVAAIQAAGGPTYAYREIDPVDDQDGGEPGGNIRVAFLFRTDRGLTFVDRPGGDSTTSTSVLSTPDGPQLSFSPGRIDPGNTAWSSSRKPLAGEFLFNGRHLFVIANHFNSKGGDDPLFGRFQPPTRSSEAQRLQQAYVVNDFVDTLLGVEPNANVVVLGDLNDFEFSAQVQALEGGVLHDLIETLPQNERYSYDFEGNAQTLDHILSSDALFGRPFTFDVVHVNSEFAVQASDHDPSVVRITFNDPPTAGAGGPYAVAEGASVSVSGSASDPDGGALSYAWDLDGDGTFETPGQNVTFSAAGLDGPASPAITVRVTDDGGLTGSATATVHIANVAPTVTITGPAAGSFYPVGTPVSFSGTFSDPGTPDTHTAEWSFDALTAAGAVTESAGSGAASATYTFTAAGVYAVTLRVTDDDGATGQATTVGGAQALIVVYDTQAGFVTGGGTIVSPAGAYRADPALAGRASFAFSARYQASTPRGEAGFRFALAGFELAASTIDWLVVARPNAQIHGTGMVNGASGYTYLLTATDGGLAGGDGIDRFRLKVWGTSSGTLVYDNALGAPDDIDTAAPEAIAGGSIVIHP
ncbi:MAG TPA: PKD domain-containing protein [Candidatus Limnocylindria bacterium]